MGCTCNTTCDSNICQCNTSCNSDCGCDGYVCNCDGTCVQYCQCQSSYQYVCPCQNVTKTCTCQSVKTGGCQPYYQCTCDYAVYGCICYHVANVISTCSSHGRSCSCDSRCYGYASCSCNQIRYNVTCGCYSQYGLQCKQCYSQAYMCSQFDNLKCDCDVQCNSYTYDPTDFTCDSFNVCNQFASGCQSYSQQQPTTCQLYNQSSSGTTICSSDGTNSPGSTGAVTGTSHNCSCYTTSYLDCAGYSTYG